MNPAEMTTADLLAWFKAEPRDGFTFDTGPSLLTLPQVFYEVLVLAGTSAYAFTAHVSTGDARLLRVKLVHAAHHAELVQVLADPKVDLVAFEKDKIKGAVRTDFILSAEIIAITLGTVAAAPFTTQVAVLVGIAVAMTVGVYGFVAGIVKLDDAGLALARREGALARGLGGAILWAAPWLMKTLSVAGTIAMFLVGGGILVHGIPGGEEAVHHLFEGLGGFLSSIAGMATNGVIGVVAGALVLAAVMLGGKLFKRGDRSTAH